MSSPYVPGEVIRVTKNNKQKLLPALVLEHDTERCESTDQSCIRIRFFHSPYCIIAQSCGSMRGWKVPTKAARQGMQSWIRQAFNLAEKYLESRESFVFPSPNNFDSIAAIQGESSFDSVNRHPTDGSEIEISSDQLSTSVASQKDTRQHDPHAKEALFSSDLSPSHANTSSSSALKPPPSVSPVMPTAIASKDWRSLSKEWQRTPAPTVLTKVMTMAKADQPTTKAPDACFFEARRAGLDPASFSVHLSPLYRILYVDSDGLFIQHEMGHSSTFVIPERIYWDRIRTQSAKIMIAPIAENGVHPAQWPKPREFSLEIGGMCIENALIPAPWGVKSALGGLENLNPLSLMYLLLDISKYVETPRIVFSYERRALNSRNTCKQPVRFAFFVLEYCDIPRFLGKIETLLEKRRWQDLSMIEKASLDEDDVVVESNVVLSLKCPISMRSIRIPVRGSGCTHAQVIDLSSFVSHIHQSKQWRCPLCSSEIQCLWDIIIDEGMHDMIKEMKDSGEICSKAILDSCGSAVAVESFARTEQTGKRILSEESLDEDSSVEKSFPVDTSANLERPERLTESFFQGHHKASAIEIE